MSYVYGKHFIFLNFKLKEQPKTCCLFSPDVKEILYSELP